MATKTIHSTVHGRGRGQVQGSRHSVSPGVTVGGVKWIRQTEDIISPLRMWIQSPCICLTQGRGYGKGGRLGVVLGPNRPKGLS